MKLGQRKVELLKRRLVHPLDTLNRAHHICGKGTALGNGRTWEKRRRESWSVCIPPIKIHVFRADRCRIDGILNLAADVVKHIHGLAGILETARATLRDCRNAPVYLDVETATDTFVLKLPVRVKIPRT